MGVSSFNFLDLAIIAFVLLSALVAYLRGFVREALALLSWIGAGLVTYYLFEPLKGYARAFVPIQMFADIATATAIFIVALLIFSFISGRIAALVSRTGQGSIDRALGFLFGLARGALFVCAAYLLVSWVVAPADQPAWLREARTAPLVREGAAAIDRILPPEIASESRLAASRAETRLRREAEERLLEGLNSPTVRAPAPAQPTEAPPPSYGEQQRRNMERLIRGTQ